METERGESKPKRSKVWRVIVVILAIAYFWTTRHLVWFQDGRLVLYNKWTGSTSSKLVEDRN